MERTEKNNRTLIFADKTDTHGYKDRFIARGKMRRIRMLYFVKSFFVTTFLRIVAQRKNYFIAKIKNIIKIFHQRRTFTTEFTA